MSEKLNILNIKINRSTIKEIKYEVANLIDNSEKFYVCVPNSFLTVVANEDKNISRVINNAEVVIPDGMPLVWYSKTFKNSLPQRISGFDFFYNFSKIANKKNYSYFFMGGNGIEVLEKIKERLENEFKYIKIKGYFCPPFMDNFSDEVNIKIINSINKCKPDILWVGLSAPKQEKWIYDNIERLNIKMACGIGAVFDFYSGNKRRAPVWMQKIGVEWFFRFSVEPKRLFKRYLIYNTKFILLVLKDILKRIFKLK